MNAQIESKIHNSKVIEPISEKKSSINTRKYLLSLYVCLLHKNSKVEISITSREDENCHISQRIDVWVIFEPKLSINRK